MPTLEGSFGKTSHWFKCLNLFKLKNEIKKKKHKKYKKIIKNKFIPFMNSFTYE